MLPTNVTNPDTATDALNELAASLENELTTLGYQVTVVDETDTTTILGVSDDTAGVPFSVVVNITP
jgi:hypothetical protein